MHADGEDASNIIDEMILRAFKIAIKGVRFLDVREEDMRTRQPATITEEADNPPTPQVDSTSFDGTQRQSYKRISTAYTSDGSRLLSMSRPASVHIRRQFISHRLSLTASIPTAQRQKLVSERLNTSHDTFLSYLGSFIGRLHLQSQSSADLLMAIRQSVIVCRELLAVVEVVCAYDNQSTKSLDPARTAMGDRINKLMSAARDINKSSGVEDEDVVMTQQNGRLLMAVTGCVKAAGECVAKTQFIIERIGDFEFESQSEGLGIDIASTDVATQEESKTTPAEPGVTIPEPARRPPPPPLIIPSYEKPLPEVLSGSLLVEDNMARLPLKALESVAEDESTDSATTAFSKRTSRSLLPPMPKMASPLLTQEDYSPSEQSSSHNEDFHCSFLAGSIAISSSGTSSTYLNSMRESSMISQTTTRATTPDIHAPRNQPSFSDLSISGSQSTLADDADDGESKMLEKTYAHELLHNKEGRITGGTLPALVERLTAHESIPDSIFVSTFYLTFRLFVTPIELAKALVDRYDYVTESPHIAEPVRLRIYNVFKSWLESHWRDFSDHEALSVIQPFAHQKLGKVLPRAGKRLLELAKKVSSTEGPLVPRLVSSMGKTSTSITRYISADTPLPPSNMTNSQAAALKNWKMGGSNPTILEFDPLELARQLTIKEMNIFCSIMPEELLGSEWTKSLGSNAANVRAMSTLSTDLSNLVTETILQYEDVKKRAAIIKHWIKIAHKCLELNNYDSLMAIICSLNSSTIVRLKRTWDIVSKKRKDMLKGLQATVEPDKNYAILRRRLHDHVPPCLPFVGTYLTDLTFVDAGNPAMKQLPGTGDHEGMSVINFDKHIRTAKIIGELQRFQLPYRLTEIQDLQEWIQAQIDRVNSPSGHENVQQYYRKSLLLEPRENSNPKAPGLRISEIGRDSTPLLGHTRRVNAVPLVPGPSNENGFPSTSQSINLI
jgi:hypothetical protein